MSWPAEPREPTAGLGPGHVDPAEWNALEALRLPDLADRSILALGYAEGLVCLLARWSGAARVVGVDAEPLAVPEGSFDVIVASSVLHLVADPESLLQLLVRRLTPTGVLVVETPVLQDVVGAGFREVARPSGEVVRLPEGWAIRSACRQNDFTFRSIGRSTPRPGDTEPRVVYHVGPPVRDAWLLLEPSTYGKTTKAAFLAQIPGTAHLVCDEVLIRLLRSPANIPAPLAAALEGVRKDRLDRAYDAILDLGLERELVRMLLTGLPPEVTPILDAYFPAAGHARFEQAVAVAGYQPVRVVWDHPIRLDDQHETSQRLLDFETWASETGRPGPEPPGAGAAAPAP